MDIGTDLLKVRLDGDDVMRFELNGKPIPIDLCIDLLNEDVISEDVAQSTFLANCAEHINAIKRWTANNDKSEQRKQMIDTSNGKVVDLFGKK